MATQGGFAPRQFGGPVPSNYQPARAAEFSGGFSGLAPWLTQQTTPLGAQSKLADTIRGGGAPSGEPWYQQQMMADQEAAKLATQERQAALVKGQLTTEEIQKMIEEQLALRGGYGRQFSSGQDDGGGGDAGGGDGGGGDDGGGGEE